jgi:two-component system CheB/CheR fusion protein
MVLTFQRQDGTEVPVSLRCSPVLDPSGTVIGGSTIARDISDRKRAARRLQESERRLADIVEQATVGVAQTDLEGHLEMVNPRFCEIVGRSSEDLRGMRIQSITHVDDVVDNDRTFRTLLANGEPFQNEKRFLRPDGRIIWVSNHVSLIHDDHARPTSAVAVVLDITQRKLASEHRELLLDELNHRVKNTLATVQAIAMQTLTSAADMPAFREAFLSRLQSLSNTHNLLAEQSWRGANISDLVRAEVAPYATPAGPHVHTHGEDIELTTRQSLAISLALHELATNAGKYGAFSKPEGRVDIHWNIDVRDNARWLRLQWEERNGPGVDKPSRRGFGTRLITEGVKHDLDGRVFLDFPTTGVVCIIEFPLKDQEQR